jgi:hypothetical protein
VLPEPRPGTAEIEVAEAPASVLDALPEAELAAILDAAINAPNPRAPNPQAPNPGATEIGSGLVAGPAKAAATGAYAVQVGAFHDPNQARRAAHMATDLVPEILLLGDIDVSPLQGRRQMVYRARVAGLERETANRACNLLQAKRQECLVVRTASEQVANGTS